MKPLFTLIIAVLMFAQTARTQTNDFYDDAPRIDLPPAALTIDGEVANPGQVDFSVLPLRQVVVKETAFDGANGKFIGAYQYEGYSLYDILNSIELKKNNQEEFPPIVDLYVVVENAAGEKVVLSWGELYYPIHRHEILIASAVRRIVPSKTKDLWPLPETSKLVVASDLYTVRNISRPVKITIRSSSKSFEIRRDLKDMYAPQLTFKVGNEVKKVLSDKDSPAEPLVSYNSVFYGRGRGIHGTTPFTGMMMKDVTGNFLKITADDLKTGLVTSVAPDGYRAIFTMSEIYNRNDQAEVLIVPMPEVTDQGGYLLYPAADYFSDRSIRCLSELIILQLSDL